MVAVVVAAAAILLLASQDGGGIGLLNLGLLGASFLLYFLPSFLARGKTNWGTIFALNLLAGWTVIGWTSALFWALTTSRPEPPPNYPPR